MMIYSNIVAWCYGEMIGRHNACWQRFFFLLESSRKGRVVMQHDERERMDRGMINQLSVDHQNTFSRGHATWSATWSVGRSVGHKYF